METQNKVKTFFQEGVSIREIARRLGVSRQTVQYHLDRLGLRCKTGESGDCGWNSRNEQAETNSKPEGLNTMINSIKDPKEHEKLCSSNVETPRNLQGNLQVETNSKKELSNVETLRNLQLEEALKSTIKSIQSIQAELKILGERIKTPEEKEKELVSCPNCHTNFIEQLRKPEVQEVVRKRVPGLTARRPSSYEHRTISDVLTCPDCSHSAVSGDDKAIMKKYLEDVGFTK